MLKDFLRPGKKNLLFLYIAPLVFYSIGLMEYLGPNIWLTAITTFLLDLTRTWISSTQRQRAESTEVKHRYTVLINQIHRAWIVVIPILIAMFLCDFMMSKYYLQDLVKSFEVIKIILTTIGVIYVWWYIILQVKEIIKCCKLPSGLE